MENFIGQAFSWFTGVIEDINDPKEMGRVRVRCYGYHNADKVEVPTEELPWATPMLPVTSASMTEVGQSATGLLQGSWVIGFFRDGPTAQDPIILGSIPSISSEVNYQNGFTDPDQRYPDKNKLDIAETPLAAKSLEEAYKNSFSYTKKVEFRNAHDVCPTANSAAGTWSFHPIDDVIAPQYPKNHVISYEKAADGVEDAHIVEFDVTPGKERISTIHRTGTYEEITPTGDKTCVVNGTDYQVVINDKNVRIKGNCNLTVESNCTTKISGNWNIEVGGNVVTKVGGNYQEDIGGSLTQSTGGIVTESYGGNQTTTAPNIFLN